MIDLMYGRGMLLSLNRDQGPSTLVKEHLCRLGISVTGRRRRGCRAGRRCRVTNLLAFVVTNNRQPTERSARKCRRRPRVRHRRRRRATSPTAPRRQTRATLPVPVLDIGVQTSPARVSCDKRHRSRNTNVFGCMNVRSTRRWGK